MNHKDLLKELRRAERYCLNEYSTMAKQAADLIESQQKEIEWLKAENAALKEREERSKGCFYCNDIAIREELPHAFFCPMCGRQLKDGDEG